MSLISDSPNQQPDHAYRSACRIIELIETYQHSLKNAVAPEAADYTVTLIARSPLSPAAAALATKAEDLAAHEIGARIILAKPAPTEALQELIQALKPVLRGEVVSGRVRWARNPSLLDAHEQMTLGSTICWSGDAMRRSPQRPGRAGDRGGRCTRFGAAGGDGVFGAVVGLRAAYARAGGRRKAAAVRLAVRDGAGGSSQGGGGRRDP